MVQRYVQQSWSDAPATSTPIDAARLTTIENGIANMGSTKYVWANAAARTGETGMAANDFGYQADTQTSYRYSGSAWAEWDSVWITYTPTITPGTGSFGSATTTAKYKWASGSMLFTLDFLITAIGSAGTSSGFMFTLPSGYSSSAGIVSGRENGVSGAIAIGITSGNSVQPYTSVGASLTLGTSYHYVLMGSAQI